MQNERQVRAREGEMRITGNVCGLEKCTNQQTTAKSIYYKSYPVVNVNCDGQEIFCEVKEDTKQD